MPVGIEVIAKLGETLLDHDHIPLGSSYRLGSAVLVATPGIHQIGLVTVTMERTFRVDAPVPHGPLAWRPLAFVAGSLALHLAMWSFAMLHAPLEKLPAPDTKPRLVIRIDEHFDPPPKQKHAVAARSALETAGASVPKRRTHLEGATPTAADMRVATAQAIASVVRSMPDVKKALEGGTFYNEDDANAKGFGGGRWDIENDPDFATVKTGPGYETSGLAETASLYGLSPAEKAKRRIEIQTSLAHTSAIRGDCVPSHRIAKWLHKVDEALYKQVYLTDPEITFCLTQPVPPTFIKAEGYRARH